MLGIGLYVAVLCSVMQASLLPSFVAAAFMVDTGRCGYDNRHEPVVIPRRSLAFHGRLQSAVCLSVIWLLSSLVLSAVGIEWRLVSGPSSK